jgi:hypothetical protein
MADHSLRIYILHFCFCTTAYSGPHLAAYPTSDPTAFITTLPRTYETTFLKPHARAEHPTVGTTIGATLWKTFCFPICAALVTAVQSSLESAI